MLSASELVNKIKLYHPNLNEALIKKAYIFSKSSHGNQKRHSGELYFSHPLAVAEILIDLKLDEQSIVTALLHDVVEDTDVSLTEIENEFGEEIAKLVDGVTKLGKIESVPVNERVAENFRKLAMAMSEDIRVLLIKLADRLHNMRTIFYLPSREKKIRKAKESLEIYAPLAARIGLNKIKDELQDLSFEIIDPENRSLIIEKLSQIREQKKDLIEKIIVDLRRILKEDEMECEISGREKKPYSIWMKMKNKNIGFHTLHDIMAFRVVVGSVADCYRALGVINSNYNMIPGKFEDYISTPKENGYRSLHLAVLGPFNKRIEIQIRDQKMHDIAELGLAAHWRYKQDKNKFAAKNNQENEQYRWIRELITLFENTDSASEVLKSHKLEMHKNEVFCFTPNGDIFNLPYGATLIDFAYAIHSEVGNNCTSAKVNGAICPLRQKLENGDQVEIITSKNSKPSLNWLQFATTTKAKTEIKHFIRSERFEEYRDLGKAILTKFFATKNLDLNEKTLENILPKIQRKTVDDAFVGVAEGKISRYDILKLTYPDYKEEDSKQKTQKNKKTNSIDESVVISGLSAGMAMHFGACCNPIPGDSIIGIINTGTGITIHAQFCHHLKHLAINPQRIIDVSWREDNEERYYSGRIRVMMSNKSGSLADVSSLIAKRKINIINIKMLNRSIDFFEVMIDLEVSNLEHLESIIANLKLSKKIIEVERIIT